MTDRKRTIRDIGSLALAVTLLACGGGTSTTNDGPQVAPSSSPPRGHSAGLDGRALSLWDAMTAWQSQQDFEEVAWWIGEDVQAALRDSSLPADNSGRPTDWDISREVWSANCRHLSVDWPTLEALRRFHACVGQRFARAIVQRSDTPERATIEAELSAQIDATDHGVRAGQAPLLSAPESLRGYINDEATRRLVGAARDRPPTHFELAAGLAYGAAIGDWIVDACPPGIDDGFDPGFYPPTKWLKLRARVLPLAPAYAVAAGVAVREVELLTQQCFFHRAENP